jgi:hypothetical protein
LVRQDGVVEGLCLVRRPDPELVRKDLPADGVLGECRTALSAVGIQFHQLTVRLFSPGIEGEELVEGPDSGEVRAAGHVLRGQRVECEHRQLP